MVGSHVVGAENEFEQYSKNLKLLTLSDPKPAVANIAGGFGAGHGLFYAAVSYSDYDLQTKDRNDDDGSIAFGLGLGDPVNSFGGEITIGLTSVSTSLWGLILQADYHHSPGRVSEANIPMLQLPSETKALSNCLSSGQQAFHLDRNLPRRHQIYFPGILLFEGIRLILE